MTTTPATSIIATNWSNFSLGRQAILPTSQPTFYANVSLATVEYIGDPEGNPRAAVQMSMDVRARAMMPSEATELLGEVVTRADGTEATILAILTETLDAAVPGMVEAQAAAVAAAQAAAPLAPVPPPPSAE